MLGCGPPVIDHQFVAGPQHIIRSNRNAQRRFIRRFICRGCTVAKERSAKTFQLGFIRDGLRRDRAVQADSAMDIDSTALYSHLVAGWGACYSYATGIENLAVAGSLCRNWYWSRHQG